RARARAPRRARHHRRPLLRRRVLHLAGHGRGVDHALPTRRRAARAARRAGADRGPGLLMASLAAVGSWDREVDVVVVGSGMAGTVTAIEAYDTDPSAAILIVEKMPEGLAGGSGRCAGGFVYAPDPEDIEDLKTYHRALNGP